ncbi:MAG: hypothetical protein ACTSV2_11700 [Candidatus Thorarchaeota archaeon]
MWFEILMIPFLVTLVLFIMFWIVQEGSHWQKHKFLGPFAKFIQATPFRSFATFLSITIIMIPAILVVLVGVSWDIIEWDPVTGTAAGALTDTVPIVNMLLISFLMFAAMIPVLWSSFRTWRHSVRQIADVRVTSTN